MFIKQIFLGILGASFGLVVAGGVFTVLISVGLIPRFAGKMHVARHIFILEEMVVLGTLFGDFISVFGDRANLGKWVLEHQLFGSQKPSGVWQERRFCSYAAYFPVFSSDVWRLRLRRC